MGRKVGREAWMCKIASCRPPARDLAHNPGMCPDWDLNRRPSTLWDNAQHTATPVRAKPKLLKSGQLVKDRRICLWIWRWKGNTFPEMSGITRLHGRGLSFLLVDVYKPRWYPAHHLGLRSLVMSCYEWRAEKSCVPMEDNQTKVNIAGLREPMTANRHATEQTPKLTPSLGSWGQKQFL